MNLIKRTLYAIFVFAYMTICFGMSKNEYCSSTLNICSCKGFINVDFDEVVSIADVINIRYELLNDDGVYDIKYEGDNIVVLSSVKSDNVYNIQIRPCDSDSSIIVHYNNCSNGLNYNSKVFIHEEDKYYYLSNISFEQCIKNAIAFNENISPSELNDATNLCDTIEYSGLRSNNITVTGVVQWTDSVTNLHLGKDIKVEVWDTEGTADNILLASGYTNDEGRYSFTFANDKSSPENGYDIRVKFYSNNSYVNIVSPSSEVTYSIVHPTITTNVDNDTVVTKSIVIDNNYINERAFQVLQAMTMAAKYVKEMNVYALPNIKVVFPDETYGTCYSSNDDRLYIVADDYSDWDVMQHEYGHYTRDSITSTYVQGGPHTSKTNLIDLFWYYSPIYSDYKNMMLNLAWSEGWATYFGIAAQKYFNAISLNIPNVGDNAYNDTEDITIFYDLETGIYEDEEEGPIFLSLGEANEAAIMSILYDFLDGINESFDYVQYTHQRITLLLI